VTADAIITAIATVDRKALPALLAAIAARMAESEPAAGDDSLIDVHEAATILGVSESYLNHNTQPFTVKVGGRRMFSKAGIQKFIARNAGKD
jgi:hypothetical protein